jgi:type VI secretion system protein ImpA
MALDLSTVHAWLEPLSEPDEPCGKNLEYDPDFLELSLAAQGKPETQFSAAEPPVWRDVRAQAQALMERTRDLRVAMLWVRASVQLGGFSALAAGLHLLHGLLAGFPKDLHPMADPDDGDEYARVNVLAAVPKADGLLGDLRQSLLFKLPGAGEVRMQAIAVALGQAAAVPGETPFTRGQVQQMLASVAAQQPGFAEMPAHALEELQTLVALVRERFGAGTAAELAPVSNLVKALHEAMPKAGGAVGDAEGPALAEHEGQAVIAGPTGTPAVAPLGSVRSRADALRAIDMVCEYFERTEPSNPAQFLLRRARRLIDQNFLQLIKELAPDALNEAARIMGVDPESLNGDPES